MIASFLTLTTLAPLTIRVDGRGYLRFDQGGKVAYANQATLIERNNVLVTASGCPLLPEIAVPAGTTRIQVAIDGTVTAGRTEIGRIVLAQLPNEPKHSGLFNSTTKPVIGSPGEGTFGVIRTNGATKPAPTVITVLVRAETQLQGTSFTLGDVADVSASDPWLERIRGIELGSVPGLGLQKLLSGPYIATKMRSLGLKPEEFDVTVPQGARVITKSQSIASDAIVELAKNSIADKFVVPFKLTSTRSPEVVILAPGDYETQIDLGARGATSIDVVVRFIQDGHITATRTVTLAPEPGTAQIRSGEPVTVRVVQKGAVVELAGVARSSGFLGQPLTVQTNGTNGTLLTGVVKSAGVVEVKL